MKKIFFTILLALLVGGSAIAAGIKNTMANATGDLRNEFTKSFDVESAGNSHEQKTIDNDKTIENQLPIAAKRTFSKMLDGYHIIQAIRCAEADIEVFYISADNEKESIILKIDDTLNVSIYKEVKKQ